MSEVLVLSAVRTPLGGFQGELSALSAPELGAISVREAVARAGLGADQVDEVIMGNVISAGLKQAPARQAMLQAGLDQGVGATTLNKVCGSGMKATMLAHDLIRAGSANVVVSGGMESMTNAPYLLPKARGGMRMGHDVINDSMFTDGLEDAGTGRAMGDFAQQTADDRQLTRADMDDFAVESLSRASRATDEGWFAAEIVPVTIASRKGDVVVDTDEGPRNARPEKIPNLRPAFKADGTITAANASSISDGSAALVLANEETVNATGAKPLARIVGHATHSIAPEEFTIAPIGAIGKLFAKTGWTKDDVDLFEINEAFAMVTMLASRDLGLDPAKVNVHGGACALGHPIGATGARLIVTLIHALRQHGGKRGIAALCIGGGEATAVAVELV